MTAVATFDPLGTRLSLSACEHALCPAPVGLGVRWGRAAQLAVPEPGGLRRLPIDALQQGAACSRPELLNQLGGTCYVREGAALLWLPGAQGFTGVLLDAGEWVELPARQPFVLEVGAGAGADLWWQGQGAAAWCPTPTGRLLPDGLPGVDDFIAALLSALGEDQDGDA